jgi:sugar phosphate isomerase/epimerase
MALIGATIQSILAEDFTRGAVDPRQRVLEVIEELVSDYQLDAVELFLDGIFLFPDLIDHALFDDIARLQQRLGVTMTAHLPFTWVDPSSANEQMRAAAIQVIVDAVEMTAPVEISSYALHSTGPFGNEIAPQVIDPGRDLWLFLMLRSIERSLSDLRLRLPDAPLAVETLEGFPFEWQEHLVEELDFGVCCDVAHLVVRELDPTPFIRLWLPRIRQFHIHGVREQGFNGNLRRRDHGPLGGPDELVDTDRIFSLLATEGFAGPVILENVSRADLDHSVTTLRQAKSRV